MINLKDCEIYKFKYKSLKPELRAKYTMKEPDRRLLDLHFSGEISEFKCESSIGGVSFHGFVVKIESTSHALYGEIHTVTILISGKVKLLEGENE